MHATGTLAVVLALSLGGPPAASAATIAIVGSTVELHAAPEETNQIQVPRSSDEAVSVNGLDGYRFADIGGTTLTAGGGCEQESASSVVCFPPASAALVVHLADGDDTINGGAPPARPLFASSRGPFSTTDIDGGAGDDYLAGTLGVDRIFGRAGDDTLDPGLGGDFSLAGPGADVFRTAVADRDASGSLFERIDMGPGRDRVSHKGVRSNDRLVTVIGGSGADRLKLNGNGAFRVAAGSGADRIDVRDQLPPEIPNGDQPVKNGDTVGCGPSKRDEVTIDNAGDLTRGCETTIVYAEPSS